MRLAVDRGDDIVHYICVANEITPGFELDSLIADLADAAPAPASPFDWTALTASTGCTREMYFANFTALRTQLDIDAAAIIYANSCGYLATATRTRAYRHAKYKAGVATPPARATAADRAHAEAVKWGLCG